jgi:hypothetical protein
MPVKLFLLTATLAISTSIFAQQTTADSLQQRLKTVVGLSVHKQWLNWQT